ncbi:hypothetical protein HK096_004895 [Nowakowskiella sp. JEL0078]|nr:hypothetical protein HK096_004895 [Nowakowskiella sp. JEL0078]
MDNRYPQPLQRQYSQSDVIEPRRQMQSQQSRFQSPQQQYQQERTESSSNMSRQQDQLESGYQNYPQLQHQHSPEAAMYNKRPENPRQIQRQSSQFTTVSLRRQPFRSATENEISGGTPDVGRRIFINPTDPLGAHKSVNYDIPDWRYLINEFLIPDGGVLQFVLFPLWILNCILVSIPGILRWRARSGRFLDNSIRTSRYNLLDFIPKQLLYQFSKIANLYFLMISMLQLVPNWSPTGRFTTIFPLFVFVAIAMLREGFDDLARHRADAKENNEICTRLNVERSNSSRRRSSRIQNSQELEYMNQVHRLPLIDNASNTPKNDSPIPQEAALRPTQSQSRKESPMLEPIEYAANTSFPLKDGMTLAHWETVKSRNLQVGDLVLIRNNDMIPADIVVLATTNPNGSCYIETANLDGETNLKQKQAVKATSDIIRDVPSLASFFGIVQTESPTDNLYGFDGYLELGHRGTGDRIPLTPSQLLLRGATLRNTHQVFGVVTYTGEDTKIRMNANDPRTKASTLEILTNRIVILVFAFVLILSGVLTTAAAFWETNVGVHHWYLQSDKITVGTDYAASFFSYVILFNTMVPISLYVTMEMVKLIQTRFINWDRTMYDPVTDTPAEARTSSLNEELGQVQYIFSDKTGTLTENLMVFRKLSVAGLSYFHNSKNHPSPAADPNQRDIYSPAPVEVLLKKIQSILSSRHSDPISALTAYVQSSPEATSEVCLEKGFRFLEAMALCHTIVPDRSQLVKQKQNARISDTSVATDNAATDSFITYQSSSPDEVALSDAAREMLFALRDRNSTFVTISLFSDTKSYEVLQTLEFNSTRKRMSVVYRFPDGRIILLCKGADSIILERLRDFNTLPLYERDFLNKTNEHLESFATEGLRTLLYAYRVLEPNEYANWSNRYAEASTALEGRAKKLDAVAAEIERDLILLGATAIEDKLQEGVPETIDALRRAGIKIWMLTGDKKETAVNIGHTCQITKDWSELLYIEGKNAAEIARSLESCVIRAAEVQSGVKSQSAWNSNSTISYDSQPSKGPKSVHAEGKQPHVVLVCEGETLLKMEEQHVNYLQSIGNAAPHAAPSAPLPQIERQNLRSKGGQYNRENEQPRGTSAPVADDGSPRDYSILIRFLDLGIRCNSVICCRFSPAQKALIVSEVKNRIVVDDERLSQDVARKPRSGAKTGAAALLLDGTGNASKNRSVIGRFFKDLKRYSSPSCVTLAIGDGANDIPMIQAAHVGIGITGREGLAAARSSDYSVAQFRFLQTLLFVHGRWNYVRISLFTLETFYKCISFYSSQALFQIWTGFSSATLYEPWTLSLYNIFFSSLPVLAVGVFERDLSRSTLMAVPELYRFGQLNHGFSAPLFLKWMVIGLWHAISCLLFPFILYNGLKSSTQAGGGLTTPTVSNSLSFNAIFYSDLTGSKEEEFIYALGTLGYGIMVIIITAKIAYMDSRYVTVYHHAAVLLTAAVWFAYNEIYPRLYPNFFSFGVETSGMQNMFRGYYWVIYLSIIILGGFMGIGLLDFTLKSFSAMWNSSNPIRHANLPDPSPKDSEALEIARLVDHLHQSEISGQSEKEFYEKEPTLTETAYSVATQSAADAGTWWNEKGPPTPFEWASINAVRWWQKWEYSFKIPSNLDHSIPIKPKSKSLKVSSSSSSVYSSKKESDSVRSKSSNMSQNQNQQQRLIQIDPQGGSPQRSESQRFQVIQPQRVQQVQYSQSNSSSENMKYR